MDDLDERIANLIDAEYIVKQFGLLDEKQKEELAQDISRFMYDRQADLRSPKNTYTPRYLWQGQDINHADTGRKMAVGHAGPTVPRIVNLESGFTANLTQNDPQQLNIRAAGAGTDCMFDYLVSSCFATLNGFTEGTVYTSLSGCTFKGYSNITAMAAQAFIDFGASNVSVAYICGGTYLESNIVIDLNQYMRWVGAGRTRVIIGPTATVTTDTIAMSTGSRLQTSGMTIRASTSGSSTKGGINMGGSSWLIAEDCVFRGRSTTITETVSFGILGGSSASVFLTDCELQRNGFIANNESVAQFIDCYHSGGGLGIRVQNNALISGCFFDTSGLGIGRMGTNCQAVGNHFENCTIGIQTTSGTSHWLSIEDNHFDNMTTAALDFSDGGTTQNYGWSVKNNHSQNTSSTFIAWPASSSTIGGVCAFNVTDGNGTFSTGTVPTHMRVGPNYESSGLARGDNVGTKAGVVQSHVTADFKTVRWGAFTVYFGGTQVTATAGSNTYSTNNTYYISIASSGTVTATTTGGFPAGQFPLAHLTTNSVGTITSFAWDDTYLQTTATGAPPAPADGKFITYATDTSLSANRVLAPISGYTPVGGVGFIDAGTDDGAITATLKDLTANWTQAGVFDISTAGNLTVLKHGAFGSGSSISSQTILNATESFTDSPANSGIQGVLTNVLTANSAFDYHGLQFNSQVFASAIGLSYTGVLSGAEATVTLLRSSTNTVTASDIRSYDGKAVVNTGTTATVRYGFYASNATGSGTLTTQYGFYVPTFSKGGTNWAFYSVSANSAFGGSVIIGGTSAPATTADIRGAVTLDGVSAPSTPASDDGVLYNETGTDFLKYKEDNAAVYNLTHKHLWDAAVDVTTASTTVPPMLVGPMPNDGTITAVYAKLTDNKTNGATSSIFDIHKILLANANTDGQGTTIYTTQANRPTISNGNMYQAATAPDVTTFAAGDWFAIYVDQTGTTATFAVVGMHVRYT